MTVRKTVTQRQAEQQASERRTAWAVDLTKRGFKLCNRQEYYALQDIVNLLCLAARRFPTPFDWKDLQADVLETYKKAHAELERTVCWQDFEATDPALPDDGKAIYLSIPPKE